MDKSKNKKLEKLEKEIFDLKDDIRFLKKILLEIHSSKKTQQDEDDLKKLEEELEIQE